MSKKLDKHKVIVILGGAGAVFLAGLLVFSVFWIGYLNREINSLRSDLEKEMNGTYEAANEKISRLLHDISIYLPQKVYVASGVTIELYNSQVTSIGGDIENYHVTWVCDVGCNMERKFSMTGTDELIGEYPLEMQIYNNKRELIASAQTTIEVVNGQMDRELTILTIGDSLSVESDIYQHLTELSKGMLKFAGTKETEGYRHEARRGFSPGHYLTDSRDTYVEKEPVHPFYNKKTGTFDWKHYKKKTGVNPDVVEIFLGTNEIDVDPKANGDDIKQIVDSIREDDPNIPIYVVNTIYCAGQDGLGAWHNAHGYAILPGRYKYEEDLKVFNLMVYISGQLKDYANVFLIPASLTHDSANNFGTVTEPVSPHSTVLTQVPDNGIHPGAAGYYQIADCIYSTIQGTVKEWK